MKFNFFGNIVALAAISLIASQRVQAIQPVPAPVFTNGLLNLDGSNIINLGPVVYAYNLDGNGTSTTLNGVTFTGIDLFYPSYTPAPSNFSISGSSGYDSTGNGTTPSDAIYTLQESGAYYNLTLSLNNLTPGQEYAAQLTIGEQPGDGRYQSYTDSGVTSNTIYAITGPQYFIDTFTATSSTETLQANVGSGSGAQLTGFVVESVPEPSTWAMMVLGALAFLGISRRARFNS
jgi:hypothetical protein